MTFPESLDPPNELIHTRVHALITSIESLHEAGQFQGDVEALLDLIDLCGHDRPVRGRHQVMRALGQYVMTCRFRSRL